VFAHACRHGGVHAFRHWLNEVVATHPNVSRAVFYETARAADLQGTDFDFRGRMDWAQFVGSALLPDADYYVCGPVGFMSAQVAALHAAGIPSTRIHTEIFGSGTLD
jgi:nitric oxide dioxygenase